MIARVKTVHISSLVSLVLLIATGCATERKYCAFEPKGELASPDPTAYANYERAMSHCDRWRMAYEWQRENPKAVEEATKPEVLSRFVKTPLAADALLLRIGTAYDGDPIVLTQIAAVTQLVMCPKCPKAPAYRKIWVAAFERARAGTDDGYVRTFCDQQLRLCR